MDPSQRAARNAPADDEQGASNEQQRNELLKQLLQQQQIDQQLRNLQQMPAGDVFSSRMNLASALPPALGGSAGTDTMGAANPLPFQGSQVSEGAANPSVSTNLAPEIQSLLGTQEGASARTDNALSVQNQLIMFQQLHQLQSLGQQPGQQQHPSQQSGPLQLPSQLGIGIQGQAQPGGLIQQESMHLGNMLHQARAGHIPGALQAQQQQRALGALPQMGLIPAEAQALFEQQLMSSMGAGLLPAPGPIIPSGLPNAFNTENEKKLSAKLVAKKGSIEPFPEKLHRLLTEVEETGRSDIICFVDDGASFEIHKPEKFFDEIVPQYFKHSKLSSFKRQLNLYGFELINSGPHRGGYVHPEFRQNEPELCRQIRRRDIKYSSRSGNRMPSGGTNSAASVNNSATEMSSQPDFYNMPPITSSEEAKEHRNEDTTGDG